VSVGHLLYPTKHLKTSAHFSKLISATSIIKYYLV